MANHSVGGTLAPNDIMGLLQRQQQLQVADNQGVGRSAQFPLQMLTVPEKMALGIDPSKSVGRLRNTPLSQEVVNMLKKEAGFTAFTTKVAGEGNENKSQILFQKSLDVKAQGGSF